MDDDWKRHLAQFTSLCDEYETNDTKRLVHFVNSLRTAIQAYQHYMKLKTGFITLWYSLNTAFEARYHSDTKRAMDRRQLKAIRFADYQANNRTDPEAFKQMIANVENLSSLAHEDDQSNHALCACLCIWIGVECK